MLEGKWKNNVEFRIVLEDWDPETITGLLSCMYTADLRLARASEVRRETRFQSTRKAVPIPTTTTPMKEYRHPFFAQWCGERSVAGDNQNESYLSPLEDLHYRSDRNFSSPLFSFEF